VEGELVSKEAAKLQSHLDACWMCRAHVRKIQETINDITNLKAQFHIFKVRVRDKVGGILIRA
jgi:anti-sigma factor RsiW